MLAQSASGRAATQEDANLLLYYPLQIKITVAEANYTCAVATRQGQIIRFHAPRGALESILANIEQIVAMQSSPRNGGAGSFGEAEQALPVPLDVQAAIDQFLAAGHAITKCPGFGWRRGEAAKSPSQRLSPDDPQIEEMLKDIPLELELDL